MTSSMTLLALLLGAPSVLSLWTLARDLRNEHSPAPRAGRLPPRSRPDEQQSRSEVLAFLSR
jgi:hypothetical protein